MASAFNLLPPGSRATRWPGLWSYPLALPAHRAIWLHLISRADAYWPLSFIWHSNTSSSASPILARVQWQPPTMEESSGKIDLRFSWWPPFLMASCGILFANCGKFEVGPLWFPAIPIDELHIIEFPIWVKSIVELSISSLCYNLKKNQCFFRSKHLVNFYFLKAVVVGTSKIFYIYFLFYCRLKCAFEKFVA